MVTRFEKGTSLEYIVIGCITTNNMNMLLLHPRVFVTTCQQSQEWKLKKLSISNLDGSKLVSLVISVSEGSVKIVEIGRRHHHSSHSEVCCQVSCKKWISKGWSSKFLLFQNMKFSECCIIVFNLKIPNFHIYTMPYIFTKKSTLKFRIPTFSNGIFIQFRWRLIYTKSRNWLNHPLYVHKILVSSKNGQFVAI